MLCFVECYDLCLCFGYSLVLSACWLFYSDLIPWWFYSLLFWYCWFVLGLVCCFVLFCMLVCVCLVIWCFGD